MKITKATDLSRTDNWRILLYGKPGLGKTSAIKGLPGKTLVLSLDNSHKVLAGITNIDVRTIDEEGKISFDKENPDKDIKTFIREVDGVLDQYDNLVIDNFTSFQSDWFVERGKNSKNGISNEIQDWGQWPNYFLRILTTLFNKPLNVYVTAWEDTREISAEDGRVFTQFVPNIRKQVVNELTGWTDVVGRIIVNPKTGNRGVILEGDNSVYAKNRLDDRKACKIEDLFKFGQEPKVENTENGEK